mgnify:CR=1 FL=1
MDNEINDILLKIFNLDNISKYTEFKLNKPINISTDESKKMLLNLNLKKNTEAYYNNRTMSCDSIGVVDVSGKRIIDFNDDLWDYTNKGIDGMSLGNTFK